MQIIFEIIFQVVFEIIFYYLGVIAVFLFVPKIGIESLGKEKVRTPKDMNSFTYIKGNNRYFYTESVQGIGILFGVSIGITVYLVNRYAT